MIFEPMNSTPISRSDFERNFGILVEMIRNGKFQINNGLTRSIDGLEKVRFLPNGRLNLHTVNESARLMANMAANMKDMPLPEMKQDINSEDL